MKFVCAEAPPSMLLMSLVSLSLLVACAQDKLLEGVEVLAPDAGTGEDAAEIEPDAPDMQDAEVSQEGCLDLDGDGSPGTGEGCDEDAPGWDCNDGDMEIGPGIDEVCDGLDNNCNDEVDEGTLNPCGGCAVLEGFPGQECGQCGALACEGPDVLTCVGAKGVDYFLDEDEDGYGVGDPLTLCAPEGDFTAEVGGDCDDDNEDRSPGLPEVCDAQTDNDCDDETNEASVCPLLRLSTGSQRWEAVPLDFEDPRAPTAPVMAAFDAEALGWAWLLTQSSWHQFSTANGAWMESGPLSELFPEVEGEIRYTLAIPASHLNSSRSKVSVVAGGQTYVYDYSLLRRRFELKGVDAEVPWSSPFAPSLEEVRAVWLDVEYAEDWFSSRPGDLCSVPTNPPLEVVMVVMTAEHQHVLESGHCFDFIERVSNEDFPPFALPDAPAPGSIVAAFFQGGIYVYRED